MHDWQKLKGYKEQRGAKIVEMTAVLDKADAEKRELTAEEITKFDGLRADCDTLTPKIERLEALRGIPGAYVGGGGAPGRDAIGNPETRDQNATIFSPLENRWLQRTQPAGQLNHSEPLSLSKYIRGVMTGEWDNADAERRAMSTTGTGAAIVPTPLSANLIQAAFSASQVMKAGALTVPMESATLKMARIAGAPVAGWKAENAASAVSDSPLDSVTFTSKTLMVVVKLSLELNEDAKNSDAVIQMAMSQGMALALDNAALFGTGSSNDPTGIANTAGIQTIASVGTLADYAKFSTAIQNVSEVNGQANACILSPNSYGVLSRLKDTLNQPLRKNDDVAALSFLPSNQIPLQPVTVTITGVPTGGTFTITVVAGGTSQTTTNIAFNASAATVQAALVALSNVGAGNATVTGTGPYTINFTNPVSWLGAVKVTANGALLTGGTTPAATASAVTSAFVADWRQLMVGMRQNVILEMSREAADSTNSAWVNGQLWLRAYMRGDIQLAHPNQFVNMTGITVG